MVGTGRTTMAILELAAPTADDIVLITAAARGIGTLLIQASHAAGATVVGAAGGADKVALVRRVGADHAIDYSRRDWPNAVRDALADRPVTLVLDGVGGQVGQRFALAEAAAAHIAIESRATTGKTVLRP
jgi:NADPH2:quinone reductase